MKMNNHLHEINIIYAPFSLYITQSVCRVGILKIFGCYVPFQSLGQMPGIVLILIF